MSTVALAPQRIALESIDVAENMRELDQQHVDALAGSIALRGLIVPLLVRTDGERFALIAGHHRLAACRKLGLQDVEITLREQDGTSADGAAENVVRKQLSPLEEAQAVKQMLEEGYTLDGAATVLGWSRKLVSARAKILELPELAQQLIGRGELPVSAVATVAKVIDVSPALCDAALRSIADGVIDGEQFAGNPAWAIGHVLREGAKGLFAAYLSTLSSQDVQELRLGKKALVAYGEAQQLHKQLDRHAYGPPPIRFGPEDIDQARAAGVLIEFENSTPVITDREVLRVLARGAIDRTLAELSARGAARVAERASARSEQGREPTASETLEGDHRAALRELTARAHGTNLDLGAVLLQKLATVDPGDMDVARFFALGLLGPEDSGYLSSGGRVLVVFAAQHYAHDLVLASSKRRSSALPRSRKEAARKAFERVVKQVLPASHAQLQRALDRETRTYAKRHGELMADGHRTQRPGADADADRDAMPGARGLSRPSRRLRSTIGRSETERTR